MNVVFTEQAQPSEHLTVVGAFGRVGYAARLPRACRQVHEGGRVAVGARVAADAEGDYGDA